MYFERIKKLIFDSVGEIDYDKSITELYESSKPDFSYIILVVLAAFIATLGLISNSAAVIIGAMIISPIMSPIMLSGASFAIMDKAKAKAAAKAVLIGIFIAVVCGILTVIISPVKENTAEILARTTPNILDLFIAFFCGVAGALSVVSEKISKGVVGVAISVALMPPLCVGAFGIATAQMAIAVGGFWMFFLNMAAIFVATFAVLSIFGYSSYFEARRQRHFSIRWVVSFGILALISIPLIISLKNAVLYKSEQNAIAKGLEKAFNKPSRSILQKKSIEKTDDGYEVTAFLDTVKSYDTGYVKSVEKNISERLASNIKLSAIQRGVLYIGDGEGKQFSLFDTLRQKADINTKHKESNTGNIDMMMKFAGIESYEYDNISNSVTIRPSAINVDMLLKVQQTLLQEGIKSFVILPQNAELFNEDMSVFSAKSIARLIKISDFAIENDIALDITIFAKAKNLQKLEKIALDIFGQNRVQIQNKNSKLQTMYIVAKDSNATK